MQGKQIPSIICGKQEESLRGIEPLIYGVADHTAAIATETKEKALREGLEPPVP